MRFVGGRSRGRWISAALVAGLISVATPSAAHAGMDVIGSGSENYFGSYGPKHSLTSVWATWSLNDMTCVNALEASGGTWAGGSTCTTPSDTNVGHPYNGTLRYGWGGAQTYGFFTDSYIRQFW